MESPAPATPATSTQPESAKTFIKELMWLIGLSLVIAGTGIYGTETMSKTWWFIVILTVVMGILIIYSGVQLYNNGKQ